MLLNPTFFYTRYDVHSAMPKTKSRLGPSRAFLLQLGATDSCSCSLEEFPQGLLSREQTPSENPEFRLLTLFGEFPNIASEATAQSWQIAGLHAYVPC